MGFNKYISLMQLVIYKNIGHIMKDLYMELMHTEKHIHTDLQTD